jgi:hypothetical protein
MFDTISNAAIETNENSVVVTNDKQAEAPVKSDNAGVNAALFTLTQMANERELWEANEYAASRKRLYQLLTQCYEYYITMKLGVNKAIRGEYKKALNDFCEQRGYNFKKTTHDMNVVVSAIFNGSTRSRISAYAQALRVALESGGISDKGQAQAVLAVDLAAWIEKEGGVEEIRTGSKNSGMTQKEQAAVAAKVLDEKSALGSINADFKTFGLDTDDSDKQMVLVVTYRNTGQFEINALVKDNSAVKEALACYYKANKLQDSSKKSTEIANQSSFKQSQAA